MKKPLTAILICLTLTVNAQQQYAPDKDTIIDGTKCIIKHYIAKYGTKWIEFELFDTLEIDEVRNHRNKVFLYFDSLMWVQSRENYCDSIMDIYGWENLPPCYDSSSYYMNYWNALTEKQEKWLFMEGGKNVLSSFPEYPLSAAEEEKLKAYFNRKK